MDYWKAFKEALLGCSLFNSGREYEKNKNEKHNNKLKSFIYKWLSKHNK